MKFLVITAMLCMLAAPAFADTQCSSGKAGVYTYVKWHIEPAAEGKAKVTFTYRNSLSKAIRQSRWNFRLIGKHQDWYIGMASQTLVKPGDEATETQVLDVDPKDLSEMQTLTPTLFCVEDTTDESGHQEHYHR